VLVCCLTAIAELLHGLSRSNYIGVGGGLPSAVSLNVCRTKRGQAARYNLGLTIELIVQLGFDFSYNRIEKTLQARP